MITKNEKAKGLWWRLLATLPVLAVLLIANTKVTAQEQQSEKKQINVEIGQFEIYDDYGNLMNLTDTIIYNEDGTYIQFKTTEAPDPISGEMRNKITATSCNADGTPNENIHVTINAVEKHGDTTLYSVEPFTLSTDKFKFNIQTTEDNPIQVLKNYNDTVYQTVDEMPRYQGGDPHMMKYVAENIVYPQKAKENGIEGRVFVGFIIEKDGSVSNVKVLRGIGGGCDEEAVRVISAMPKWKPGKQGGKPVRVSYMMPINFKLRDNEVYTIKTKDQDHRWEYQTSGKFEKAVKTEPDENDVYQTVEEMPQYPGGETAMMEYVAKNVVYPKEAQEKGISGRVFVGFIVEKDGSIGEVKLLRGIGGGCDEEAIRVIKGMPKWKPGKQEGKPVRVSYQMPINFKLQ